MEKKKVIKLFGFLFLIILVFLPGYSKFQELAQKKRMQEEKLRQFEAANEKFKQELRRMQEDKTYVEKIARDKLKVSKKGEIIYKIIEGQASAGEKGKQ